MYREQAYQTQQHANQTQFPIWNRFQPYWSLNYPQNSYFIPLSQFTGPDQNSGVSLIYFVPLSTEGISINSQCTNTNLYNGEAQPSLEPIIVQKKNKKEANQLKKQPKKRRKIIELQNIKDNERNRNILSNCLKLALKNIRNSLKEDNSYFQKIVRAQVLHYSQAQFEEKLDKLLPFDINYIRPAKMRELFIKQDPKFTIVLKIFIRKFFKEQIYASTGKYTQMKKLIKNQHIKAGRKLLSYFFSSDSESDLENSD